MAEPNTITKKDLELLQDSYKNQILISQEVIQKLDIILKTTDSSCERTITVFEKVLELKEVVVSRLSTVLITTSGIIASTVSIIIILVYLLLNRGNI